MKLASASLAAAVLAAAVGAQSITLNGQTGHVNVYLGQSVTFQLVGPPNAPGLWAFDVSPGPVVVGTTSIPLGVTPFMLEIMGGAPLPPTGVLTVTFDLPPIPALEGTTLYTAAAFVDPSAPDGFSVTNGLSFTFVGTKPSAGGDGATLVGEPITLVGSATTPLQPNLTPSWVVSSAPAGAIYVLDHADTFRPVFTATTPGTYEFAVSYAGGFPGQELFVDLALIDVYDVTFTSPVDGSFGSGTFAVSGTIAGPTPSSFTINGAPAALTPAGPGVASFSVASLTPAPVGQTALVSATATSASGAKATKTVTRLLGAGQAISTPALPAAALRVNGLSLDPLEPFVEQLLGSIDFSSIFSAIPPIPVANVTAPFPPGFVIFSATVQPQSFTYDPTVDLDFAPGTNCGVATTLTFTNVVITSNVTGKIFNVNYAEQAIITATSAVISGDMVFVTGPNGAEVQMQNSTATLNGFALTVTGALQSVSQLGTLQAGLQTIVETALASSLQLLPPLVNPLLATFNAQTFDLSGSGVPLTVGFPLASFCYDAAGITAGLGLALTPLATGTETPTLTHYRTTPGATPTFGATTPVLALPYTTAVSMNDDTVNVLFATLTTLGTLNLDLTGALGAVALDAGTLATALPNAGFEAFAPATPVTVRVRHTAAPSLTLAAGSPAQGVSDLPNVKVAFYAELGTHAAPVFEASLTATSTVGLSIDPVTQAFTLTPIASASTTLVETDLPGYSAAAATAALNTLLQPVVAQLLTALSAAPVPTGGAAGVQEISVAGDNIAFYF
ncbi:MAG TPA: hypothetical protein VEI02_09930 [Planctomycetota bacterium]|nr:hypothetical protein [Planctomycetota bacterium]